MASGATLDELYSPAPENEYDGFAPPVRDDKDDAPYNISVEELVSATKALSILEEEDHDSGIQNSQAGNDTVLIHKNNNDAGHHHDGSQNLEKSNSADQHGASHIKINAPTVVDTPIDVKDTISESDILNSDDNEVTDPKNTDNEPVQSDIKSIETDYDHSRLPGISFVFNEKMESTIDDIPHSSKEEDNLDNHNQSNDSIDHTEDDSINGNPTPTSTLFSQHAPILGSDNITHGSDDSIVHDDEPKNVSGAVIENVDDSNTTAVHDVEDNVPNTGIDLSTQTGSTNDDNQLESARDNNETLDQRPVIGTIRSEETRKPMSVRSDNFHLLANRNTRTPPTHQSLSFTKHSFGSASSLHSSPRVSSAGTGMGKSLNNSPVSTAPSSAVSRKMPIAVFNLRQEREPLNTPTRKRQQIREKRLSTMSNLSKELFNDDDSDNDNSQLICEDGANCFVDTTISMPNIVNNTITSANASLIADVDVSNATINENSNNNIYHHKSDSILANTSHASKHNIGTHRVKSGVRQVSQGSTNQGQRRKSHKVTMSMSELDSFFSNMHDDSLLKPDSTTLFNSKSIKHQLERLTKELTDCKIQLKLQKDLLSDKYGADFKDDLNTLIQVQLASDQTAQAAEVADLKSQINELLGAFSKLDDQFSELQNDNMNCKKIVDDIVLVISESRVFASDESLLQKLQETLSNSVLKNKLILLGYLVEMLIAHHLELQSENGARVELLSKKLKDSLKGFQAQQERLEKVDGLLGNEISKSKKLKKLVKFKDSLIGNLQNENKVLSQQVVDKGMADPEEIKRLKSHIAEMNDKGTETSQALAEKDKSIRLLEQEGEQLAAQVHDLTELVKNLKNQSTKLMFDNNNLESTITKLEAQLRARNRKFNELLQSSHFLEQAFGSLQMNFEDWINKDINFQTHLIKLFRVILDKKSVKEAAQKVISLADREKLELSDETISEIHSAVNQYGLVAVEEIIYHHSTLSEEFKRLQNQCADLQDQLDRLAVANTAANGAQNGDGENPNLDDVNNKNGVSGEADGNGVGARYDDGGSPRSKLRLEEVVRRWKQAEENLAVERKQSKKRFNDQEAEIARLKAQLAIYERRG
ncbi:unnamed protein product [Ambrosiozyma monospora]|uniref:Unnamed protein product n=1 Tax=Ambrosiozyma monospora TaxID=43982 RepID=A0ACB5SWF3_AMBMO|nr:unnamed protein product [Ambrosiozyma monospora]